MKPSEPDLSFGLLSRPDVTDAAGAGSTTMPHAGPDEGVTAAETAYLDLPSKAPLAPEAGTVGGPPTEAATGDTGVETAATLAHRDTARVEAVAFVTTYDSTQSGPAVPARVHRLGEPRDARERYTLTKLHAKGGIGQVWLARDADLGRDVALKELRPDRAASSVVASRFLAEARITGQLEHPGIVPVYELRPGPDDASTYYTMRFIRGRTLSEAIAAYHERRKAGAASPLDRAALLNAFASVCNAVAYAHSRGVIHRDLKPQNVALGDFGEVMVLDWGLAKLVDRDDPPDAPEAPEIAPQAGGLEPDGTMQGQVLGTPAYMAPEQAEGLIDQLDSRTDIYALGAILYEILAGVPPFTGRHTHDLLRKVREEDPPAPSSLVPDVPKALEAVCRKAMAKAPGARYGSARDLTDEVGRFLADEPVRAYPEPWPRRLSRWAKRHRTFVTSAAAILLTGFVLLGVASVMIARERDAARLQRQLARSAVDEMYTEVAEGWLEDRLDPLQKRFLERALAYYERFASAEATDPTARLERGRAYQRLGDSLQKLGRGADAAAAYRRGIDVLRALVAARPLWREPILALGRVHDRLGLLLARRGDPAGAEASYRSALDALDSPFGPEADRPTRVARAQALRHLADLERSLGRRDAEGDYRRASALLEPIASAQSAEVEPRQELALALDGLGLRLRETGRDAQAIAAYRRAVALLEPLKAEAPTLPRVREALAKAYNSLGLLLLPTQDAPAAEDALKHEVALLERLVEDFPRRPEYRRGLARSLINLGILQRRANRPADAEASYRRAAALDADLAREFPAEAIYREDLARAQVNLGELLSGTARRPEAETAFRRAIDLFKPMVDASPSVPGRRLALAAAYLNLGELRSALGRPAEAEAALAEARTLFAALVHEFPDNIDYRAELARCLNNSGYVLSATRPDAADSAYREALGLFDRLVKERPTARDYRRSRARCLVNLGELHRPDSMQAVRDAIAVYAVLVAEDPRSAVDRQEQAIGLNNLGEQLAAAGQTDEAVASYRQAVTLLEAVAADYPKVPDYRNLMAQVLEGQAKVLLAARQPKDARPVLEQAAREQRQALEASPRRRDFRDGLRSRLALLARTLIDLGDHRAAAEAADELPGLAPDRPDGRLDAARVLSRCIALADGDSSLPEPRRAALARLYGDRAMSLLRDALSSGGRLKDRLDDPEFAPLRTRADFRTLREEPRTSEAG